MSNKETVQHSKQTPFLIRAIWFLLFGWHLTAGWVAIAWFFNVTLIGLPIGLWMLNRIPQVLTLKASSHYASLNEEGQYDFHAKKQPFFLLRAVYFIFIGWWFSLLWAAIGYLFCVSIIGLPIGLVMLNNLPFVTTLRR